MKSGKLPNPNVVHSIAGYGKEIYVKLAVKNPNIAAGSPARPSARFRLDKNIISFLFPGRI